MRKLVIAGLALLTAAALSAVAFAQNAAPVIESTLVVSPAKSGSKKKPANGRLINIFNVNPESRSTLKGIDYLIPRNIKLNGKGFPVCSEETVASGEDGCPKNSKVGTGAATALLGPNQTPLQFTVNVYVAGPKALTLALFSPAVGLVPIPATIKGQVVSLQIPERVQSPVTGLYSYVTSVTADLGKQPGIKAQTKVTKTVKKKKTVRKKNGKKKKKTVKVKKKVNSPFVGIVGCSGGRHEGAVTAFLADNPSPPPVPSISDDADAPCS